MASAPPKKKTWKLDIGMDQKCCYDATSSVEPDAIKKLFSLTVQNNFLCPYLEKSTNAFPLIFAIIENVTSDDIFRQIGDVWVISIFSSLYVD